MNRDIVWTNQFKKDYKLAQKRHLDVDLLDNIIRTLSRGELLRIEDNVLVLTLARTGSHSDLFNK